MAEGLSIVTLAMCCMLESAAPIPWPLAHSFQFVKRHLAAEGRA